MSSEGEFKKVLTVPISKILPIPENVRRMNKTEYELLKRSIREVGFADPIQVIELRDGNYRVLNGQHRLDALKDLGFTEAQVIVVGRECGEGESWLERGDDCYDELRYWIDVFRLNNIMGKWVVPRAAMRIADIIKAVKDRKAPDELKAMLGFTGRSSIYDRVVKELVEGGKAVKELRSEAKTKDDLVQVLRNALSRARSRGAAIFVWNNIVYALFLVNDDKSLWIVDRLVRASQVLGSSDKVLQMFVKADELERYAERA
ncbi:MAG: ParB N-terminal domain-containing protein [Nanopusillaceae archaeon]